MKNNNNTEKVVRSSEPKETMSEGVNLESPLALKVNGELRHEDLIKLVNSAENAGN